MTGTSAPAVRNGIAPGPDSGSVTVRVVSPRRVVSVFAVLSRTATPVSSTEIARSWLGSATATVRTTLGSAAAPALGLAVPAGSIATTVPSDGTSSHSLPAASNLPPARPGGKCSGVPTGRSVAESSWLTAPCTASTTNAASPWSAIVTPMPAVVWVVAATWSVARSRTLTLPVVRSRRITYRSVWLTWTVCPWASVTL